MAFSLTDEQKADIFHAVVYGRWRRPSRCRAVLRYLASSAVTSAIIAIAGYLLSMPMGEWRTWAFASVAGLLGKVAPWARG